MENSGTPASATCFYSIRAKFWKSSQKARSVHFILIAGDGMRDWFPQNYIRIEEFVHPRSSREHSVPPFTTPDIFGGRKPTILPSQLFMVIKGLLLVTLLLLPLVTGNIYVSDTEGDDSTCEYNDPDRPCKTVVHVSLPFAYSAPRTSDP